MKAEQTRCGELILKGLQRGGGHYNKVSLRAKQNCGGRGGEDENDPTRQLPHDESSHGESGVQRFLYATLLVKSVNPPR